MARERIVVICGGRRHEFASRKKAVSHFTEGMVWSEGSEQERYARILAGLYDGESVVTDEL